MSSLFAIVTPTNAVSVDSAGRGQAHFTVTNVSGRPVHGGARIVPQDPAAGSWLTLAGEAERAFPVGGTEQYIVRIAAPPGAPAGNYTLRLDMVGVDNPDEEYDQGPTVAFAVHQPQPQKKPFPWWILLVAAGVVIAILAVVLIVVLVRPEPTPTPSPTFTPRPTRPDIPVVEKVARPSRLTIPSGMKMTCLKEPDTVEPCTSYPVIRWRGYTYWAHSYTDNRSSMGIVAYDAAGKVVRQWEKTGARYIWQITVDTSDKTVTLWGQDKKAIVMSWAELEPR